MRQAYLSGERHLGDGLRGAGLLSALEQLKYRLGKLVGLRHHGRASLLQDLRARQVGRFHRKVSVLNT